MDSAEEASDLVIVALGSNLGGSRQILADAFDALRQRAASGFQRSSIWRTTPVDCPPGSPRFLNAVAMFNAREGETPEGLLDFLQGLEKEFGRQRNGVRNSPRTLDLDLIAFGSEVRGSDRLILPHPRAHLRRFVLSPLVELAPRLILPGWDRDAETYLGELPADETAVPVSESGD